MAEAAAVVGLVASIVSLIQISAQIVSKLHDFTSKTSDIPESFRSLSIRLPLLTVTLQHILIQAEAGRLPDDAIKALEPVVNNTSEQILVVQASLSKVLNLNGASKLERALKALKGMAKEDKIRQILEKIHKNIDVLILHQTTRHTDTSDLILEELSKLTVAPLASPNSFGVCLGQAPQIEPDAFVGRTTELQKLQSWLSPTSHPHRQCVVSIVGLGGVGKTQLSLAHVRDCAEQYSSVFWVNAKDEISLRQNMADINTIIFRDSAGPAVQSANYMKFKIEQVRRWLSEPGNDQWLLIFDNYDDPYLPGFRPSTGYDIRTYFPHRAQGSILITTRSPQLRFTKQLPLKKLEDIKQSLAILTNGSGRTVDGAKFPDVSAMKLAQRLDGLPLALSTAAAYLSQSADSFDDYLQLYNHSWNDLSQYSSGPVDYERTLYSTWNVSFERIQDQDPAAAELLKLMAYFDNQDLWYELFESGAGDEPTWWVDVLKSRVRFNLAISILHNYSLLEMVEGRYSLHTCVHDWILEYLNHKFDWEKCCTAIHCVAASVGRVSEAEYWVRNHRVLPHAHRFKQARLAVAIDWNRINPWDLYNLAELYKQNDMNREAEKMYQRALRGYEKAWGVEHTSTLNTVNNLGLLYADQGKMVEAEEMYQRALRGKERAWGVEHTSTLDTVNNLGSLYTKQGKMVEAEEMYQRALRGYEKAWGVEHTSTLSTVNNLGLLYADQGKMVEAEEMYQRALRGKEKAWGVEHTSTLDTVNNLGALYADQGKMVEAEEMYQRALRGKEKAWGVEHTSTLDTVNNLGLLYANQGKMVEAEEMYQRALRGYEKAWGVEHTSTLSTVNNLGLLYADQGKMVEAEEMYQRALRGKEKAWGVEHTSTLDTVNNLGLLYADQGKMVEAEEMYQRALRGKEKAWGVEHISTLATVNNLGALYADQGKLVEAEEMYQRALRGKEKAWGVEHISTLATVNNLGALYADQGKLVEAEEMYQRALRGKEKAWGVEHTSTLDTVNNLGVLYKNQGRRVEAEEMYQRALRGYEKAVGKDHPKTKLIAGNLKRLHEQNDEVVDQRKEF